MSFRTFPQQPLAVVTGATGYIATELVKQLLERGYAVRGTVRDPHASLKLKELVTLADALPGSIEFVRANLLEKGSFDEAVKGADVVFHVASPFILTADDPEKDIVRPAVDGTENVLRAVAKADPRPRRVVVTSSVAAIVGDRSKTAANYVYGPDDWNESSTIDKEPYLLSKTLAERRAWELAKELDIEVVTVNPSFVLGPVVSQSGAGTSRGVFTKLLQDKSPNGEARLVDVRDVALTHIRAAEEPKAKGRYIISGEVATPWARVSGWLHEAYPDAGFPVIEVKEEPVKSISIEKTRTDLTVATRPVKETILDMARSLLALGLVSFE